MLFHNYVKYRGQYQGYYFFFDAKQFEAVGVFWTKALCLYLLHLLVPDLWIIYLDTDAVMFDQLFIDLPKRCRTALHRFCHGVRWNAQRWILLHLSYKVEGDEVGDQHS